MWSKVKIAISGKSGCGNSTVSRLVSERSGLTLINYTFRDMAREKGIPFKEFCLLAEKETQYDLDLDKKQIELVLNGGCVLGSRLAIWLIKDADLKVYLSGSQKIRAARIANREKIEFNKAYTEMVERDKRDRERFIKLYNIDIDNHNFANLIINTELLDQFAVVKEILNKLKTINKKQ